MHGKGIAGVLVAVACLAAGSAGAQVLPEPVCATLRAERATYGATPTSAELGALLNAVAWAHRADGWGLSAKAAGSRCPWPGPGDVACDILHRRTDGLIWDVLIAAGERAEPSCVEALGPQTDPERPWVAPVDPGGGAPPPPPGPVPGDQLEALRAAVAAVGARLESLTAPIEQGRADSREAAERTVALEAALAEARVELAAVATSLEEHRAEARKVRNWVKDWRSWAAVAGGIMAGFVAKRGS